MLARALNFLLGWIVCMPVPDRQVVGMKVAVAVVVVAWLQECFYGGFYV